VAERRPDPRSGVDESAVWSPAFEGQRPPFEPGHELSVKHGAYANVKLGNRVDELAAELQPLVPGYRPPDQIMVRLLALTLARIEAAVAALERVDEATAGKELVAYTSSSAAQLHRLREDLRGWINTARRLANDLGMGTVVRIRLGLDVAQVRRSSATLTELAAAEAELELPGDPVEEVGE
jgi:hypothetical protein